MLFWWILGICLSLGEFFLRKKSIYVKTSQQGRLSMKWGLPFLTWVQICCSWGRRGRNLHCISPVPLWTLSRSMGIGTSCKKTGVQLHTVLPVAQYASGRKDWIPWSWFCHEALWVVRGGWEAVGAPGCLSQLGAWGSPGQHSTCFTGHVGWGSPPGLICAINLL